MLFCVVPAAAQGQNAVVRLTRLSSRSLWARWPRCRLVLADAQNAYGIDVRATFDPQVVEVVDADPAKDGIQLSPGTFPQPDFVARNVADNQAGTLRYAITQVNPTQPVSGTGVHFHRAVPREGSRRNGVEAGVRRVGGSAGPAAAGDGPERHDQGRRRQGFDPGPGSQPAGCRGDGHCEWPRPLPPQSPPLCRLRQLSQSPPPRFRAGLPCAGGALLPALGLLGLASRGILRRSQR